MPLATAGAWVVIMPPVTAVQTGVHFLGMPEQRVLPVASNAYSFPSAAPTYATRFTTAGDESTSPPVSARQSGAQVFGLPEQFTWPAASNAYKLLPDPTYTTPSAIAGEEPK